jgi:hypothetical protein
MHRANIAKLAFFLSLTNFGHAAEVDAKASKIMWSAWMCSQYASLMEDEAEKERLFLLGYNAGKQFLAGVQAGTITQWERISIVPMIVEMNLSGPTPEFVLGRLYQSAAGDAFDKVTKKDANGIPLEVKDWITSDEQKSVAETRFRQENCEIIK